MLKFLLPLIVFVSFFSGHRLEIPEFSVHHSFQELQSSPAIILRSDGEREQKTPSLDNLFLLQTHHFVFVGRVREFRYISLLPFHLYSSENCLLPRGPPAELV